MSSVVKMDMDIYTENKLLLVIRSMAEDLIKLSYPENKCPVHGNDMLHRDRNGIKRCTVIGCNYLVPGSEPTVSVIIEKYLEKIDAC